MLTGDNFVELSDGRGLVLDGPGGFQLYDGEEILFTGDLATGEVQGPQSADGVAFWRWALDAARRAVLEAGPLFEAEGPDGIYLQNRCLDLLDEIADRL